MKYEVEFERIGRNRSPEPLTVEGTEDELLDAVITHCGRYLASSEFDVTILLDDGMGYIDGGRFGEFSVKELDGAA